MTHQQSLKERAFIPSKSTRAMPAAGTATSSTSFSSIFSLLLPKAFAFPASMTWGIWCMTRWSSRYGSVLRLKGAVGQQCEKLSSCQRASNQSRARVQLRIKSTTFSPQLTCMRRPFAALNYWGLLHSAIFELDCGKKLPLYCWSGNILLRSALEEGIMKTSMHCLRVSTICVICRIASTCICMPPIITSAVMESASSLKPMRSCCETCMTCYIDGSDSTSTCFLPKGTFSRESCPRESGGWGARAGRKRWRAAKRLECFLNLPYSTTCTPQGRSVGSSFLEPMLHSLMFNFSLPVLSSISSQSLSSQRGFPLPYLSGYSFSKALTLLAYRRLMVPAMQYRVPFSLTWAMGSTPATLNLSASCAMRDRYMFLNSRPTLQSLLFHSICGASTRPVSLETAAGSGARESVENWARRSKWSSLSIWRERINQQQ